jgi:hypothetical protein
MNAPSNIISWDWQKQFRSSTQPSFLRIKIKYLAAEARIIKEDTARSRKERRRLLAAGKPLSGFAQAAEGLRDHRLTVVRPAARESQLALAFLRGMPYLRVECSAKREPSTQAIARIAWRFAVKPPNTLRSELHNPSWKPESISGNFLDLIKAWLVEK